MNQNNQESPSTKVGEEMSTIDLSLTAVARLVSLDVFGSNTSIFYVKKTEHVCLRSHITQQNLWPVSGNVSHSGCFCSREMRKPTGNQGPHCGHFILCAKMTPFLRFNFNIWTLWQKLTGLNSEKIIMLYYMIITAVVTFTSDQTFAEHLFCT